MPSRQHFIHETIQKFLPRQVMRLLSLPRARHFMLADKKVWKSHTCQGFSAFRNGPLGRGNVLKIFSRCAKTLPTPFSAPLF